MIGKIRRKLSTILYGEDRWVAQHGSFREREARGLVTRPNYCYGMLRAADQARFFGHKRVTVLEFGVASGGGLLNMIELAQQIRAETGVEFDIVGFDAGSGLPKVQGYKDHAELWMDGDFAMEDRDTLLAKIGDRARIIFGDIADTLAGFTTEMTPESPVGFVSVDVDIYTATVSSLKVFDGKPELYLPAVGMYFDDMSFFYANRWAGELLAIEEFNAAHEHRKIDIDRSMKAMRAKPAEGWYDAMYACHILDHDARNKGVERESLTIDAHHRFMRSGNLY